MRRIILIISLILLLCVLFFGAGMTYQFLKDEGSLRLYEKDEPQCHFEFKKNKLIIICEPLLDICYNFIWKDNCYVVCKEPEKEYDWSWLEEGDTIVKGEDNEKNGRDYILSSRRIWSCSVCSFISD